MNKGTLKLLISLVSVAIVSLGTVIANSLALPDAKEAQRGSGLSLLLCIY